MATLGRPVKPIDWNIFDACCRLHATLPEICGALGGIHSETLERACLREHGMNYTELSRLKRGEGKLSLRRTMWKKAIETADNTMLIWLAKQHLNMADRIEHKDDVTTHGEVKIVWQEIKADKAGEAFMDENNPSVRVSGVEDSPESGD